MEILSEEIPKCECVGKPNMIAKISAPNTKNAGRLYYTCRKNGNDNCKKIVWSPTYSAYTLQYHGNYADDVYANQFDCHYDNE